MTRYASTFALAEIRILRAEIRALRVEIRALRAERTGPPPTLEALEESLGPGVAVGDRVIASVPGGTYYLGTVTQISEYDRVQVDGVELRPGRGVGCNVRLRDVEVLK